jgi:hypothetical protein
LWALADTHEGIIFKDLSDAEMTSYKHILRNVGS